MTYLTTSPRSISWTDSESREECTPTLKTVEFHTSSSGDQSRLVTTTLHCYTLTIDNTNTEITRLNCGSLYTDQTDTGARRGRGTVHEVLQLYWVRKGFVGIYTLRRREGSSLLVVGYRDLGTP